MYAQAKNIARRQLAAVGVIAPDDTPPSADANSKCNTMASKRGVASDGAKEEEDGRCEEERGARTKQVCKPPRETKRHVDKKKCRVRPT